VQLRPYQQEAIERTRRALKVHGRVLLTAPTGAGKTAMAAHMLRGAADRGLRAWFVVHRRELVEQTARTLDLVGADYGYCAAGFAPAYRRPVTLCSVQTLRGRMERLPAPHLIVWDEAHHCAAGTWRAVADRHPTCYHVGLTATPQRLDGKGLDAMFKALVPGPSIASLIEQGYLAPFRVWSHPSADISHVRMRAGEFDQRDLADVVDKPHILGDAVRHVQASCPTARAVAFCVSIDHAIHTRDAFRAAGFRAEELDGTVDGATRKRVVSAFRRGEVQILTSIDLFGEGFDLPELEAAILLRPTASLGLYMQQVGRALRAAPGKTHALILDHAGNVARHGLPDQEREWSLRGRPKRPGKEPPVKTCPGCFGTIPAAALTCEHCGHVFKVEAREIDQRQGDLKELDLEAVRRARLAEVRDAKTREQLEAIAAARGYKPGWVNHVLESRAARAVRPS
jgi:superfamily II DNA or RNA helicase